MPRLCLDPPPTTDSNHFPENTLRNTLPLPTIFTFPLLCLSHQTHCLAKKRFSIEYGVFPGKTTVSLRIQTSWPSWQTIRTISTKSRGKSPLLHDKEVNFFQLTQQVFQTFEDSVNFCQEVGLLSKWKRCTKCKGDLKLVSDKRSDAKLFPIAFQSSKLRFAKKGTYKYVSFCNDSFFEGGRISLGKILALT